MTLEETMQKIRPVDAAAMAAAKQHWDGLGKPLGSLGRLEKALIQIAGIQRTGDVHIDRKALAESQAYPLGDRKQALFWLQKG